LEVTAGGDAEKLGLLGPHPFPYRNVLAELHRQRCPKTYVEIGIATGDTILLAGPETEVVGIDPQFGRRSIEGKDHFYRLTSDEFFARHDLGAILGRPVDFAFIDGMHLFEFALRDLMNIEQVCTDQSLIALHDCLPRPPEIAARENTGDPRVTAWTGDVWKLILCLADYRPDLRVELNPAPPTGLLLVGNLDPDSRVLRERYDEICERYIPLDYPGAESLLSKYGSIDPGELAKIDQAAAQLYRSLAPRPEAGG
jgi:hypothetical protein